MNRRHFLAATSSLAVASLVRPTGAQPATRPTTSPTTLPADLAWHDVRDWGLEGKAFADTAAYFDRLPGRAKAVVRKEVWNLSRHTAGMIARFRTDASAIYARYGILNESLAMPHMPATGVSGLDLYGRVGDGISASWQWVNTCIPKSQQVEAKLSSILPQAGLREFLLHLPLYNGVTSLEIGVPKEATFEGMAPRTAKPIVWYGTSITQGGCASRPGLAFTNILSRRLPNPIHNFGFSGNGKTEIEVGNFLAELDASLFILDTVSNTSEEELADRTGPLVRLLRKAHPDTPILLLEDRSRSNAVLSPGVAEMQSSKRAVFKREFDKLIDAGVPHLHYRTGDDLLGTDGEGTVDGSHPNDLGMMRYADALEGDLRKLVE